MKRATIKDVAQAANVSISAVSRTFTPGASVAAETRQRVLEVAERLEYRPSPVARGLIRRRSNTVTVVSGRMTDPFDSLFIDTLAEALAERDKRLVLAPARLQSPRGGGFLQALDDQSEAIIVAAGTMPLEASDRCIRAGIPIILAGRIVETPGIDSVVADNPEGARQAAEVLLKSGCTRLCYFGQARTTFSDTERHAGFVEGAKGQAVALARPDGAGEEALFDAATRMLLAPGRPDGVFCATDRHAFALIEAARATGLSVPADVSVIGFNNIPAAAGHAYRLTTVDYPVARVVAEVLRVLDLRLAEPEGPPILRRIPVHLVLRETTRRIAP